MHLKGFEPRWMAFLSNTNILTNCARPIELQAFGNHFNFENKSLWWSMQVTTWEASSDLKIEISFIRCTPQHMKSVWSFENKITLLSCKPHILDSCLNWNSDLPLYRLTPDKEIFDFDFTYLDTHLYAWTLILQDFKPIFFNKGHHILAFTTFWFWNKTSYWGVHLTI